MTQNLEKLAKNSSLELERNLRATLRAKPREAARIIAERFREDAEAFAKIIGMVESNVKLWEGNMALWEKNTKLWEEFLNNSRKVITKIIIILLILIYRKELLTLGYDILRYAIGKWQQISQNWQIGILQIVMPVIIFVAGIIFSKKISNK